MVESVSNPNNRMCREIMSGAGQICLGSVEYSIRLLNVSLTGFLAELDYDTKIPDFRDLLQTMQAMPVVDIYLCDFLIAGEAQIARVEAINTGFQLGIEFRNLTYGIDKLLFKRRVFRKHLNATGRIVINAKDYSFLVENVSVSNMIIRIVGRLELELASVCRYVCQELELYGQAQVLWVDRDYNSTLIGLLILDKTKAEIKDINSFLYQQTADEQ